MDHLQLFVQYLICHHCLWLLKFYPSVFHHSWSLNGRYFSVIQKIRERKSISQKNLNIFSQYFCKKLLLERKMENIHPKIPVKLIHFTSHNFFVRHYYIFFHGSLVSKFNRIIFSVAFEILVQRIIEAKNSIDKGSDED